jgi:hypothetical protein
MKTILTLIGELKNANNEIAATIEANASAAVQHGEAIEQLNADNEALAALRDENVQFMNRIETIVLEELDDNNAE